MKDRQKELRVKYRNELDLFPPPELVVPRTSIARKSGFFSLELAGFVPIEVCWELVRDAIDDALAIGSEAERDAARERLDAQILKPTPLVDAGDSRTGAGDEDVASILP